MRDSLIRVQDQVRDALRNGTGVVALESTIIAHGMPYPSNLETALGLEAAVRRAGAVPATIAVIDGVCCVGLSRNELERLARAGPASLKVSRRDLAVALARRALGATTVSATLYLARRVGIPVFSTGGIGGVHRGGETSLDISSDLIELGRDVPGRPGVSVVCSGVKSILDIGRTLEFLETQGVCVLGYQTDMFPGFYIRDSGFPVSNSVWSVQEAAHVIQSKQQLGCNTSVLLAVPVPREHEPHTSLIESAIGTALQEATHQGLNGPQLTPFLLSRISQLTQGRSLQANIQLALHNAQVAATLAMQLSGPSKEGHHTAGRHATVLSIGGLALDWSATVDAASPVRNSSNPGRVRGVLGGVGRNIAVGLVRRWNSDNNNGKGNDNDNSNNNKDPSTVTISLVSAVADDWLGRSILHELQTEGVDVSAVLCIPNARTSVCVALHAHDGELRTAIADFDILEDQEVSTRLCSAIRARTHADFIVLDANFPVALLTQVCVWARSARIPLWFEPTSTVKCRKIVDLAQGDDPPIAAITWTSPNRSELLAMASALAGTDMTHHGEQYCARFLIRCGIKHVVVTQGSQGASLYRQGQPEIHVPAHFVPPESVVNTTGAGDALVAAMIHRMLTNPGEDITKILRAAVTFAAQALSTEESIPRARL